MIELVRLEYIKGLSKNTKEYKIAIHSNRITSHLVMNLLTKDKNITEELIKINCDKTRDEIRNEIKNSYLNYIQKITNYLSPLGGIHIPRFFENKAKLEELITNI